MVYGKQIAKKTKKRGGNVGHDPMYLCGRTDDVSTATEVSKCVTLLDAIQWLTSAWEQISEEAIEKCFKKCGFFSEINGKFN